MTVRSTAWWPGPTRSSADEKEKEPTSRRVIAFARRERGTGLTIVNG